MNLKRDIYQTLLSWKNEINHQPLMVIGQAQVGKTFIVRQFANEQYQKLIELDFLEQPQFSKYFENHHGFEDLLTTWINDFKLDRDQLDHYLFFFDNIQECPKAITALKMINEANLKINLICAAKYLDYQNFYFNWPVGQYQTIEMKGLTFSEFIDNLNRKQILNLAIAQIKSKQTIAPVIHQELLKWFDYYLKIGGFPQVISTFIETQFNYEQSQNVLKQIAKTYLLEIYEYSELFVNKKPLIAIYKSLPRHLSQPSHKFVFQNLKLDCLKFRDLESYLLWLESETLVLKIDNLKLIDFPLINHAIANHFKLYYNDHGLFNIYANLDLRFTTLAIQQPDLKGLYESFVASQLYLQFNKIYYYAWINHGRKYEIDFVVTNRAGALCLISVLSNPLAKPVSLNKIKSKDHKFVLSTNNYQVNDNYTMIPIYLAFILEDLI